MERWSRRSSNQLIAWLAPALAGGLMLLVLFYWSAHDVRDDSKYIVFYFIMWLGWTGLSNRLWAFLGLSCRDDLLERDNLAAGVAVGGALLGVTFIFAGGNIGEGPGWWVVVFSAGIATVMLLLLWLAGNWISRVDEAITIDRDLAAGWRWAGFFMGAGLMFGRAVAGDWHSAGQTTTDFLARGWPALMLWGVVVGLDLIGRPTPARPSPNPLLLGVLPGLVLIAAGAGDVYFQGPW